ncbi:hypothetical protein ERO13_D05G389101v2 [Gossypium hirsutum]|nr:hypothetical protein ERO13_D05G389101v2 [Gossypium hirsutum]
MSVSFQILPLIFFRPERRIQRHYIVIFSTVSVFGIFGIPCFIRKDCGKSHV